MNNPNESSVPVFNLILFRIKFSRIFQNAQKPSLLFIDYFSESCPIDWAQSISWKFFISTS